MAIITGKSLPRRTFLRAAGTALALPFLDAMTPAFGAERKAPVRAVWCYVPCGIDMRHWTPSWEGKFQDLPAILKPLEGLRGDFTQLGHLSQSSANGWTDLGGEHGRAGGNYLTGVHPRKSATAPLAAVSVDQVMANEIGSATRFPSLQIGMEDAKQTGSCDSGYSCAYTNNLSWRSSTQPLPPILDPRSLFNRLFGNNMMLSPKDRREEMAVRRSILSFVNADVRKLASTLGASDRRKLDEYTTSIREIELQFERAERENAQIDPGLERPYGTPPDFAAHFKLMTDILTVAFQADLTRVVTFLMTRESSQRTYPEIGIPEAHHQISHHLNNIETMDKITKLNTYHVTQMAEWLQKLKATSEGDSNLLNNSMIVYGSGLADGNSHIHEDLPTLLMGGGGGYFKHGRRLVYRRDTPMTNLWVTMMDRMGVQADQFGDSTGYLEGLSVS